MLVDYHASETGLSSLPRLMRANWPQARCIALVEDETGRRSAEEAGVDLVLTEGVRAAKLLEKIERLLARDEQVEENR